jgi:hypothetical protein
MEQIGDVVEMIQEKSKAKAEINLWLLSIAFTLFALIISINPALARDNIFLSLQLTLAIPILIHSIFARTRTSFRAQRLWYAYGYMTFTIGYAFLMNVVGILLSNLVSIRTGFVFWGMNIFLVIIFAVLDYVGNDKEKIKTRLVKDLFFIFLLFAGGIFPVLGLY